MPRPLLATLLAVAALALAGPAASAAEVGPTEIAPGGSWSHVIEGSGTLGFHLHPTGAVYQVDVPADTDGTTTTVTVRIIADGDDHVFAPAEPKIEQGDTVEFVNDADTTQNLMLFTPSGGAPMDHDGMDTDDGDDTAEGPGPGVLALTGILVIALASRRRR